MLQKGSITHSTKTFEKQKKMPSLERQRKMKTFEVAHLAVKKSHSAVLREAVHPAAPALKLADAGRPKQIVSFVSEAFHFSPQGVDAISKSFGGRVSTVKRSPPC